MNKTLIDLLALTVASSLLLLLNHFYGFRKFMDRTFKYTIRAWEFISRNLIHFFNSVLHLPNKIVEWNRRSDHE